jgi:DNA-binding PadR family transcriptional regulator
MKSPQISTLNNEVVQEFGALLLLDHLMRYELLQVEKVELEDIIDQLEIGVAELKKGFFRSDEQEQELSYEKEELREAKKALSEVKQEMEENRHCRLNIALAETDDEGLESLLNFMESRGTLTVEEDNYYKATDKGHEVYQDLVKQLEAYVTHFEVYAYVDLEQGIFGDPETDLLEGEKWSDLRVAVAEHKGIDPYRVVFLAMLSAETFYENPDWKFDLSMGTLFQEMKQIVLEQLHVDDLGYSDSEGKVPGEEVIRDIIEQGSELVAKRKSREHEIKGSKQTEESPDEQVITTTYYW